MAGTTLVEEQAVPRAALRVGDVVDHRYELLSELRVGGMGVVWQARDLELERDVCVKEMRFPEIIDGAARIILGEKLADEARRLSAISHPGLVRVHSVVETAEGPLIVTESTQAENLAEWVALNGPMSPDQVVDIGADVAEALLAATSAGLHHRFLRPSLVLLSDDGPARLADFGVCALVGDPDVEASGAVGAAAAAYLAPEHRQEPAGSGAGDVWSLGATLYFAVEGRPPFEAESAKATLAAVATEPHRPAANAQDLGPVIDGLLAKKSRDRPDLRSIPEIMSATRFMLNGPPLDAADLMFWRDPLTPALDLMPEAPPPDAKAPPRPDDPKRRHKRWAVTFAALGVIGLLATLLANGGRHTPPGRTKTGATQWVDYRDPESGFHIAHPPGWLIVRDKTNTDFRDPVTNAALRVGFQRTPSASPEQVWLDLEAVFKVDHPSYERIRLLPTPYAGLNAAAWEFVWTDSSGQDLHNEDLAFNASGFAFALNFQTKANNWIDQRALFEKFVGSFRPPA